MANLARRHKRGGMLDELNLVGGRLVGVSQISSDRGCPLCGGPVTALLRGGGSTDDGITWTHREVGECSRCDVTLLRHFAFKNRDSVEVAYLGAWHVEGDDDLA